MFLYLGAYNGQNLGKTCRNFVTRIRKEAKKTAINHTFVEDREVEEE
jgi:hypothetical protein